MNPLTHPDDERLAALAGGDPEAADDTALRDHVAACARCRDLAADLTRLRAALAELPDLAPPPRVRALRLPPASEPIEPAAPPLARRFADIVRRAMAPAMLAGASLALIGAVGVSGVLDGARDLTSAMPAAVPEAAQDADDGGAEGGGAGGDEVASPTPVEIYSGTETITQQPAADDTRTQLRAEGEAARRSSAPWLAVMIGGLAVAGGALLVRLLLPAERGERTESAR